MVKRKYWIGRVESAWKERNLVWLSGVRRSGKTMLCRSLENVEYFDCELPRVRRQMGDPEEFLGLLRGRRVALDEIHRLDNPSETTENCSRSFSRHEGRRDRLLHAGCVGKIQRYSGGTQT